MSEYDVVIIGSGPAGFTAAIYCSRAMLKTVLITGFATGGQLMTTTDVENYPGYPDGIRGPDLMDNLRQQAEKFGTKFMHTAVMSIEHTPDQLFKVNLMCNDTILTKSVIIASGAVSQWLDLPGELKLRGRGVSTCATCDGAFFKGDDLIVVGGGDSAMEEAIFLTRYARKVTIVHRRDEFRASKIMLDRARNNHLIEWVTNATVKQWEVDNSGYLCGAVLDVGGVEQTITCQGAFIAIGHKPVVDFLPLSVEKDQDNYIILHPDQHYETMTSVPGIFAAGDVTDRKYKQAITAAGQGCKAALDVEKWLESQRN